MKIHRSATPLLALLVVASAQAQSNRSTATSPGNTSTSGMVLQALATTDAVSSVDGVCDVYARGGTPCVAAYATTRALYGAYAGNLYQVRRSDNATKDIGVVSAGGLANAATQDAFCSGAGAACRISIIYDQSGKGNHLTKAPAGSPVYGLYNDSEAVADALPILLNGQKVYGVHVTPGGWTSPGQVGYRNTATNGVAKGDTPETMYMVTDGTYVNGACCFDFGNAEMSSTIYGDMETIYFGTNDWWGKGTGSGPWVMGDLENGVYSMGGPGNYSAYGDKNGNKVNGSSVSFAYPFVTAVLKGNSATATDGGPYTLKGGNSQSGPLTTVWDGPFPVGYSPRNRQGGIVLGVGGDNSSGAQGNFYEGVLTTGFASNALDDEVQANIVAAGYGRTTAVVSVPAHRDSVFNGRFDLGTLGWNLNVWGGGAQGSVANGVYAISIDSIGTHNSDIQVVQNGLVLEQGKTYQVTFEAYASASRPLEANVEKDDSPWTSYLPAVESFELTTGKTTYSYRFTMTEPTDSNGRLAFNAGASTGSVFLDNVEIHALATSVHPKTGSPGASASVHWNRARLQVDFQAPPGSAIAVELFDLVGRPVLARSIRASGGANQSWSVDLSGLSRGVYLLGIQADGRVIHRSRIPLGN